MLKDNSIYEIPFFGNGQVKRYFRDAEGMLQQEGQLNVDPTATPSQIAVKNAEKAYLSLTGEGKITIVHPGTLEKTGEIDITSYGVGDENPDPAGMVVRGDFLFVALNQMVGGFFAATDRPKSDVLVIDTTTDTVVKMITESTSGISQPTRAVDASTMFVDENDNIYVVTVGTNGVFASLGHKAGILKINAGETEFDADFSFSLTDATIGGFEHKMDWLINMQYMEGGKLYALANVPALSSMPPNFVTDKSSVPVVIDLVSKTVTKLDLPHGTAYACVGKYEDTVVFGMTTENDNGFYTYDTKTGVASDEAVIKTEGSPIFFGTFE